MHKYTRYLSWPFFWIAQCDDLGLLRPEASTVGCCWRQQNLWSHRKTYSGPEAAIFSCGRGPQDFLNHMYWQKSGLWSLLLKASWWYTVGNKLGDHFYLNHKSYTVYMTINLKVLRYYMFFSEKWGWNRILLLSAKTF